MRIDILTGLPNLLQSPLNDSIVKRSQSKGIVEIVLHDLREFSLQNQRSIDDFFHNKVRFNKIIIHQAFNPKVNT